MKLRVLGIIMPSAWQAYMRVKLKLNAQIDLAMHYWSRNTQSFIAAFLK